MVHSLDVGSFPPPMRKSGGYCFVANATFVTVGRDHVAMRIKTFNNQIRFVIERLEEKALRSMDRTC